MIYYKEGENLTVLIEQKKKVFRID